MKSTLLFLALCSSAALASNSQKQNQCAQLVKIYNRCESHMSYKLGENQVNFPSLNSSALCDDGKDLPFEERLSHSDISSMLSQEYPLGVTKFPNTVRDLSPGGIRNSDFTKATYGATESEVEKNLVSVDLLGQKVLFNKFNGAAAALAAVNRDLMALYSTNSDPALTAFLRPFVTGVCRPADRCRISHSTFVWRVVAGTTNLSNHSFGVAIDLQPEWGPEYWLWDVKTLIKEGKAQFREGADLAKKSPRDVINFSPKGSHAYPQKLIEVFERHGFIWGGKWYRYDLMHFEFRPEFFPAQNFPCGK
ncbi:MAG: M15 family metallopeptidase [Bdellovibrionota bacterium]